jgi:general L-amino acid transport system substrate-binding protein
MTRKHLLLLAGLVVLAVIAAQCGGATPVATEAATEAPAATVAVATEEAAAPVEPTDTPAPEPAAQEGSTLATVRSRGRLLCAVSGALPAFGFLEEDGTFSGFDADYCRAVAAAIFDDPDAVEIQGVTATDRFPLLQSGGIDVLVRNTTWTFSRDTSLGFNFAPTTFYDGQGMMVRKDSGIGSLEDLEGGSVCVQQGTTTEKNLADVFRFLGIDSEVIVFADADGTRNAYDEGRCDGFTTDKSGLIASQLQLSVPDDHIILAETMSKEPLGPLVRHGDDQWFDIVKWITFGTFQAEELGITSANVEDTAATSDDPVVQNLLGGEGDLWLALDMPVDTMVRVIKHVGNYGEIYNRHLGPDTPYNVPRGVNSMWTEGGLLYSPPFR